MPPEEWYRSLPRKRIASAVVVRDGDGRVLLVEPTYRDSWAVPGGVVEADESPRDAAAREALEELGIEVPVGRLLALDWRAASPPRTEGLLLLYDGGVLDLSVDELVLPPNELRSAAFVAPEDLDDYLTDVLARRVRAALVALADGTVAELESS